MVDFLVVHRNDHFILPGPPSDEATALPLVWQWSSKLMRQNRRLSAQHRQWLIDVEPLRIASHNRA
jgi:hypothetical protein